VIDIGEIYANFDREIARRVIHLEFDGAVVSSSWPGREKVRRERERREKRASALISFLP
jgi:hypothetical protein